MKQTELYEILPDGRELIRTYSDENKYIQKLHTPELYEEAIDAAPTPEYVETDIDIPTPENKETVSREETKNESE